MKRSQSRFSSFLAELLTARLSSFAKFSGATIPRRKPPGSEKKIFARTTETFLLTNPNLEGEIHLKGGRFVTSQNFNGAIIPRRKQPGSERKTYGRTTLTYFLANPNLEGEIHLKGVGL